MSVALASITFDCRDAVAASAFWSGVLERPVDDGASVEFASIGISSGQPAWMFIRVPEGKTAKNRVHVDLTTADHRAEAERLLALGATKVGDYDESGARWITLADPEGNEFCVVSAGSS
jgi:hypothetical protein